MSVIPLPILVAPPLEAAGGLIGGLHCFTVGNSNNSSNNTNNVDLLSSKVILVVKVLKAVPARA